MYLNLNIKEWCALQALLEQHAADSHPDDVNHLDQVRRRMRSIVGESLKDVDKGLDFERWVHNERSKVREIEDEHRTREEDRDVRVTIGKYEPEPPEPAPLSEREYPQAPAMPRAGKKARRR